MKSIMMDTESQKLHQNLFSEIFKSENIYIYGMGEVAEAVISMLNTYINEYMVKINIQIAHNNVLGEKQISGYPVSNNFEIDSFDTSCLIIASDEGEFDKTLLGLIKKDFGMIVDGYKLIHFFFQPLNFRINTTNTKQVSSNKEILVTSTLLHNGQKDIDDDWKRANSLEKMILLNYIGRSGSYYFTTLLDNHPELIVMPFKILYNPFEKITALCYCYPHGIDIEKLIQAFAPVSCMNYNTHMLNFQVGDDNIIYPEGYVEKYLNMIRKLVLIEVENNDGIVSESFLIKVQYYSHMIAMGIKSDFHNRIPYMVNPIHTTDPLIIKFYQSMFPKVMQIATVRNPITSFASLMAGMKRMNMLTNHVIMRLLNYTFSNPAIADEQIAETTVLVRLEDLNTTPKQCMKSLCDILDIEWDKILLKNTLNGKTFYDSYDGSNKSGKQTGPRTSGITKTYEEYLSTFDKFRLEAIFYHSLKAFGYDVHEFLNSDVYESLLKYPFRFEKHIMLEDRSKLSNVLNKCLLNILQSIDYLNMPQYLKMITVINNKNLGRRDD